MKAVVSNDHGGVNIAKTLIAHLKERNIEVNWLGVESDENHVDYPDQALKAATEFKKGGYDFGILCCGTGEGISMAANKIKGIRCALPVNIYAAEKAKQHNNANFIAFGGRIDYPEDPVKMLDAYIDASFEGGRHQRRIDKIMSLESL